jgi:hypothetical protein
MKKKLVLIVFAILALNLFSLSVDKNTAQNAAIYWMESNSAEDRDFVVSDSFEKEVSGTTCLYFFNFEKGGFVMMSADNQLKPILGYDFESSAIQNPTQPAVDWFMNDIADQIHYAVENNLVNQEYTQEWRTLIERSFVPENRDRDVNPLLTCNWNQDYSWNLECPEDNAGPGGHVYVGCVAVAMAQIMYYWEYPTTPTGSHGYTHPDYGYLFEEFGNYNFNSMNNSYATSQTRTLLYHCGVAVNMDYGPDGSGANTNYAENALKYYFDFSLETEMFVRDHFEQSVWEDMLRTELEAGRPMYYAGQANPYGHAFNIDGYQNTNYFHLNWGWSGYQNGYFYLNNLNGFNTGQEAIMGIQQPETAIAPYGLTADVYVTDVMLTWINPSVNREVTGYNIYRNEELVSFNQGAETINYYDMAPGTGEFIYYITAMYSEAGESAASNEVTVNFNTENNNESMSSPEIGLIQNYPNPFNPTTTISFSLSADNAKNAELIIFNSKGREIKQYSIINIQSSVTWNGTDSMNNSVSSGIYFYKLLTDGKVIDSKKMVLLK